MVRTRHALAAGTLATGVLVFIVTVLGARRPEQAEFRPLGADSAPRVAALASTSTCVLPTSVTSAAVLSDAVNLLHVSASSSSSLSSSQQRRTSAAVLQPTAVTGDSVPLPSLKPPLQPQLPPCQGVVNGSWVGKVFLPDSRCSYRVLPLARAARPDPQLVPACLRGKTVLFIGNSHSRNHFRCLVDILSNGRSAEYNTQWPRSARVRFRVASDVAGLSLCENTQGDHRTDLVWYDDTGDLEVVFLWSPTSFWRYACSPADCITLGPDECRRLANLSVSAERACNHRLAYSTSRTMESALRKLLAHHKRPIDYVIASFMLTEPEQTLADLRALLPNTTRLFMLNTHGDLISPNGSTPYWFFSSLDPERHMLTVHIQAEALLVSTFILIDHLMADACPHLRPTIGVDVHDYYRKSGATWSRSLPYVHTTVSYSAKFNGLYRLASTNEDELLANWVRTTDMDSDGYYRSLNAIPTTFLNTSRASYATLADRSRRVFLNG
jgi:hypothetical protein